jgi:hypothetical protein
VFWGCIAAVFFVLVFPGNVAQLTNHRDAFSLDTDLARMISLNCKAVFLKARLAITGGVGAP